MSRLAVLPRSFRSLGLLLVVVALAGCSGGGSQGGKKPSATGMYAFWPRPPADPHVQFLQAIASRDDVSPNKRSTLSKLVFGEDEVRQDAIQKPYGIDIRDGRLYVCDIRKNTLIVLDFAKQQMRLLGATGFNTLANPVDVHVAEDGMIYVADNERLAVFVFGPDEKFRKIIGHDDFQPVGLATHGDRLYVCNLKAELVEIFDRFSGEQIGTIGEPGTEDGEFRIPLGIDTDGEGNVYVVDMMRCRIQKFSPEGDLLAAVGAISDTAGSFARPKQIAVDHDGIVYVVDAAFQNVQMFDSQFRLLMHFGAAGEFAGSMNLPAGICVDDGSLRYFADELHPGFAAKRLVLVSNQFGPAKVSAYAMGERAEGWTIAELTENSLDYETGTGQNPALAGMQVQGGEELPSEEGGEGNEPPPEGGGAPADGGGG